ncbi:MAG: nuclear transport factor 2 family protein, partial [Promethearchaeota archaeon]
MKMTELENIQKSIDIFVDGLRSLDYDKISEIFFEKALSCGSVKGSIHHVYRDHWKEMAEQARAKGEDLESSTANYSIKSLNIIGNAASVIIDLTFGTGDKITDASEGSWSGYKASGEFDGGSGDENDAEIWFNIHYKSIVPELSVSGSLSWDNVELGETKTGKITIKNTGEAGSTLAWD